MGIRELLEADLLKEQAAGFFSDFYVEAGRLDSSAPSYSFGNSSSLFDLASLSKALATGPLVHQYLRSHAIDIKASFHHWAPGVWQSAFSSELMNLSIEEVLAHRSGLPAWRNFWMGHLNEGPSPQPHLKNPLIPETFARMKSLGEKVDVYSDLGYILLGYALEAASGQSIDQLWKAYLKPFGVNSSDLGYRPLLDEGDLFVPSAFCAVRERLLKGEVHDENCAALGGVSGHAGLFGRGPALGKYLRNLSHSNEGLAYLKANDLELQSHERDGLSGLRRGNGTSAALFARGKGMGHLGFVGTAFWLDLPSNRYAIFLSNRVISGRVNPHITAVRRSVFGYLNELV
jgi:CubicO group peptidase (beta-lactamase class C family)